MHLRSLFSYILWLLRQRKVLRELGANFLRGESVSSIVVAVFEGIIVKEFHTPNDTCSSLVLLGPAHANISLQDQFCTHHRLSGLPAFDGNTFELS